MQESYLKALRLKNIQSWKDLTLEFSSGLNVIEARNESGKSVPIKVKRAMLMPMFFDGDMSEVLRRRNEDVGEAWWYYTDFTVKFEIYPTYQIYRLLSVDGVELESWKQNTLPRRLRDLLHIYYDQDEMVILNIIDQELGLIFDSTSPSFNATVLNFFAEDADLSKSVESLGEWIEEIQRSRRREQMNKKYLEQLTDVHKYIDLDTFRDSIDKRERLLKVLDFLVNFQESLYELTKIQRNAFIHVDENRINTIVSNLKSLADSYKHITEFKNLLISRRKFVSVNEQAVTTIVNNLSTLKELNISSYLNTLANRKEFKYVDENKLDSIINTSSKLKDLGKTLTTLTFMLNNKRTFKHTNEGLLQSVIEELKELSVLSKRLSVVNDLNSKRNTLKNYIARLDTKINQFKEENSICPLCEQPFERGNKYK